MSVELPDDMRCALHSLQADMDYLIARLRSAESEEVGMIRQSIFERLSHVEEAAYRMNTATRERDSALARVARLEEALNLADCYMDRIVKMLDCESICLDEDSSTKIVARTIKSALSPPPVAEGWRPIESAPKDGTYIIAYPILSDASCVVVWQEAGGGFWRLPMTTDPAPYQPTHWQPRPANPIIGGAND